VTQTMSDLRTVFERAMRHLETVEGDPDLSINKYLANLEADQFGVIENARKLWSDIVQVHPFKASVWIEYIQLEKTFGDKKHLRKTYLRAIEKVFDNPEAVVTSFIQFEREEGSLEAFEHCLKMCNLKRTKVDSRRDKDKSKEDEEDERRQEKIEKKKEKDKQYRRDKRQDLSAAKKENSNGRDSVFIKPSEPKKVVAPPPGFPGRKNVAPPPGFPGDKTSDDNKKRSIPPPPGFKGEPPSKKMKGDNENEELSNEEEKRRRTVFLSNLDFEVTDDEINDIMSSSGSVVEVRLVKNPTGKSKGYAFVEFEAQSYAKLALGRDNELIGKRPMYVSECDSGKKEKDANSSSFKYGTGLEKNKLYVKGLDLNVTRPELAEIFGKFGKVSAVRLVTYRNGHSKGIAFIEFEDEVSAATALVKADNMAIKGKEIEVALSNPPKRKEPLPSDMKSLGGTTQTEFGPRGKARSQVAFTPRSVANTPNTARASEKMKLEPMKFVKAGGNKNGTDASKEDSSDSDKKPQEEGKSKSNSDFRKMFLQ